MGVGEKGYIDNVMKKPLNIIIDGKVYDLKNWRMYHPGGHYILQQYHNKDATEVFHAFHGKEGFDRLAKMKGKPIEQPEDPVVVKFRKFRQQLYADGWFEPNHLYNAYKVSTTVGLLLFGFYLVTQGYWFIGALFAGLGYQQLGWLGHDSCHHNLTKNRRLNIIAGYFFGNFLAGFSVNWWKNRHNTHHAITNVLDADPDVDNLPLFCWDEEDLNRVPDFSIAKYIVSYQEYYFLPFTFTLKLIWKLQSIVFLSRPRVHNKSFQDARKWEIGTLVGHWIMLFWVMSYCPSISAAISFFLISEGVGGAGIALIVFMNHYALDQLSFEEGHKANFITLQLEHTRNIAPSPFMNWIAGGLNFQVEHHLFPTIPRNNMPYIRPLVQKFCKENDIPYHELDFWGCLDEVHKKLARISAVYKKSKAL